MTTHVCALSVRNALIYHFQGKFSRRFLYPVCITMILVQLGDTKLEALFDEVREKIFRRFS